MAALAVGQLFVGQAGIIPGLGIVAVSASAGIMAVRSPMAVGAVRVVVVNEPYLRPVVDVVAGGALAGLMGNGGCVAAYAIILTVVVESDLVPGIGSVTRSAKAAIVGGRCFGDVAALAIFQAAVIDNEGCPVGCVMAAGTIFAGMVGGRFVTGCAVGVAGVVEHGRFPIICVMTGGTFKMIMRGRIVFQMAGNTIIIAQMIEYGVGPVFGVCVAVDTRAGVAGMIYGGSCGIADGTYGRKSGVKQ